MSTVAGNPASLLLCIIVMTVCLCFAVVVLAGVGVAIWGDKGRLAVVLGKDGKNMKTGLIGFAAICGTVMIAALKVLTTVKK